MNVHGYQAILAAIALPHTQGVDDDAARDLVTAIVRSHIPQHTPTARDLDQLESAARAWHWPYDYPEGGRDASRVDLAWCLRIVARGIPGCADHARLHISDDPCIIAAEVPPVAIYHPTLCVDCEAR